MKPKSKTPKAILATLSTLALAAAPFASAALVNVNFYKDIIETEADLFGPLGGLGSTWNQSTDNSGTDVLNSSGAGTDIDWSYSHGLEETDIRGNADPALRMLVGSFGEFGKGNDQTLTIGGLVPGELYNVAIAAHRLYNGGTEGSHGIFSTTNATTSATAQTVDGNTALNGDTWELGVNYAHFENVEADVGGEISFLADATDAGVLDGGADTDGRRFHLNGFQIESVPEPSSAALLGLGGLALILRRRK